MVVFRCFVGVVSMFVDCVDLDLMWVWVALCWLGLGCCALPLVWVAVGC